MTAWMRGAADAIGAALLSPGCAVCAGLLESPSRGSVCPRCWNAVAWLTPPFCVRCGYPTGRAAASTGTMTPVDACLGCAELRVVDRARALGSYEGTLRDVLHALKYGGRRSTAFVLARLLRERGGDVLAGADAVLPVPLHPRREWARGFNQAALVARGLGPPVRDLLRRRHHTSPQAGLSASDRRANVARAFALSWRAQLRPALVRNACLVLVDDVSTTGATLDACAAVLKASGAREVRALVVARTLKGRAAPP